MGDSVRQVAPHDQASLIADANSFAHHGETVSDSLATAGYKVLISKIDAGEQYKNLDTVRGLYEVLLDGLMERRSPVVALGGGVVGDTAGFAAATYLRGVPFVQCPTTLLAMVDASIGGKVGVNVPQGKNLVGAFYQPSLVLIDTDTLKTLPQRELRCGLAECVKHAMIRDSAFFHWIDQNLEAILALHPATLEQLIQRNVEIKSEVVMADEKESGQRAHLNFGHTFAHAIEATQSYDVDHGHNHGEAVALGMIAATRLAVETRRCSGAVLDQVMALLQRIGLPTRDEALPPPERLVAVMQHDKKVQDSQVRLVLPHRIGSVSVAADVATDDMVQVWSTLAKS